MNENIGERPPGGREVILLLPGQGAQHNGMAVELYGRDPVFTEVVDDLFDRLGSEGAALRGDWLSDRPRVPVDDARRAQPLLFALGYALGRSLASHGVRPVAYVGHSVGELAAAALAGVFDPTGAAQVMAARSAALIDAPVGGMLAVAATPIELTRFLDPPDRPDGVVVAALNAPRQTVVAGPEPRLSLVGAELQKAGVFWRRVDARQPFHCPAVAAATERFTAGLSGIALRPPTVPIRSTRTTGWVRAAEAVDPEFWAGQLASPVLFWPALDAVLAGGAFTLVEAGPGEGLSVLARRHPAVRGGRSVAVPALPATAAGSWRCWQSALERLGAATGTAAYGSGAG